MDTTRYFEIADRMDLSYGEKSDEYSRLIDEYFEVDRYADFCASRLARVGEVVYDWVCSESFDTLLVDIVRATYPVAEHDRFVAHFRGLIVAWVRDQEQSQV